MLLPLSHMAVSLLRTGMCSFRLYPQHVESAHTTGSTRYIPAVVVITLPWRFAPRNPINTTPFSLPLHDSDEEMGTQRSSSFSPRQASKQQSGPLSSPQFSPTMSVTRQWPRQQGRAHDLRVRRTNKDLRCTTRFAICTPHGPHLSRDCEEPRQ